MAAISPQWGSKNRYTPKLGHLWVVLPIFMVLIRSFREAVPLLDFWWHLKMGQVIAESGAIPRVDIFSFTAPGKLFVIQNWLAEFLYYSIYRAGGLALAVFAHSLLMASTIILMQILCLKSSRIRWATVLSMSLVGLLIPVNMRPQIFSYLLFTLFYYILISYKNYGARSVWFLPGLMILWVNLHGAFILGLGLISIILFSEILCTFLSSRNAKFETKQLYILAVVLLLSILCTLANPEGYKVYDYALTVFNDPSSRQFVTEWQAPAINNLSGAVLFYIPFFILTFCFIWSENRPSLTEVFLYTAFSVFGMMAIRNTGWFLLIAAPMISRYLPMWGCWEAIRKRRERIETSRARILVTRKESTLFNTALLIGAFVFLIIRSPWLKMEKLEDSKTPVAAIDYVEKHDLKGHIYHPQAFGDYLIWRLWPKHKSFIDGRVHLYDTSLINCYFQIMNESNWEQHLEKYQIRYLLLSKNPVGFQQGDIVIKARKSKSWKLVFEDPVAVLFEKSI